MSAVAPTRRLAGIAFETQPPPSPDVLPRMDVAGFVGFAASGPIGVPVPVEDSAGFEAVFGGEAPLAWDAERSEQVSAQLAPAVRAFFRNGGRRAWIVRVAGEGAQRTPFPVPGLVCKRGGKLATATLPARAAGSWSDGLLVQTALVSKPAAIVTASVLRLEFRLEVPAGDTLVAGDLLRVRKGPYELLVAVQSVEQAAVVRGAVAPGRTVLKVRGSRRSALWLGPDDRSPSPPATPGTARLVGLDGRGRHVPAILRAGDDAEHAAVDVTGDHELAPPLGSLLSVDIDGPDVPRHVFVEVSELAPADDGFTVSGRAFRVLHGTPKPRPALGRGDAVERLSVELRARLGAVQWSLGDLGLAPGHPRYLGDLPTDEELYARHQGEPEAAIPPALRPTPLWPEAASPRFPLAGRDLASEGVYYPLGMQAVFGEPQGADRLPGTPLGRDGLGSYSDALFLDSALRGLRLEALGPTADYIRWQSPQPRELTGVHALLALDEVTIVAVPDAVHRGWRRTRVPSLPSAATSEPAVLERRRPFDDCAKRVLRPRPLLTATTPDSTGTFRLDWDESTEPRARFVLQESADVSTWEGASTLYEGRATGFDVYARPPGTYAYRVRAEAGGNVSDWSRGRVVRISAPGEWLARTVEGYDASTLVSVQRALLRMCASRGDIVCVLSLPDHYADDAAIAHAGTLRAARDLRALAAPAPTLDPIPPLDASELAALSYGALYHPWLTSSRPEAPEQFVRTPPDGPATGVLALRAATRGAWIAPANVLLRDVVLLTPAVDRTAFGALQQAQVNEVRQEADGFLWLSADTLAIDPAVRPLNVRRLLALLRRLALLRGVEFVFEPHSNVFRRNVQRSFEATLTQLFVLGAFAGTTPDEAFRVEVGSPPNTQQTMDAGQLIVDLKVAPSRPLAFLTIRLVGDADRGFRADTR